MAHQKIKTYTVCLMSAFTECRLTLSQQEPFFPQAFYSKVNIEDSERALVRFVFYHKKHSKYVSL